MNITFGTVDEVLDFSVHKKDCIYSTNEMAFNVRITMCWSQINYIIELLSKAIFDKQSAANVDENKTTKNGDQSSSDVGEERCFNASKV